MAVFYIKDGNEVFELSATTDVAINYNGSPTRFKVEDGSTVTDHYIVENATCSFNGVITDIVSLNNSSPVKTSKEYIEGLRRLQLSKRTFTVFADDKLQPFDDCLFTDIGIVKSATEGLSGWVVTLAFEQIRKSERAKASIVQLSTTNAKSSDKDNVASKTDSGTSSTKREITYSSFRGGSDALLRLVGDKAAQTIDGTSGAG